MPGPALAPPRLTADVTHVACLCAAWCRLCDDYHRVWRSVVEAWPAQGASHAVYWHWIDIEDEAQLMGDIDVETFPTVIIVKGEQVRFAGPLTPQPETIARVLRATLIEGGVASTWPAVTPEMAAFAQRLGRREPDAA